MEKRCWWEIHGRLWHLVHERRKFKIRVRINLSTPAKQYRTYETATSLRSLCLVQGEIESHTTCLLVCLSSVSTTGELIHSPQEQTAEQIARYTEVFLADDGSQCVLDLALAQVKLATSRQGSTSRHSRSWKNSSQSSCTKTIVLKKHWECGCQKLLREGKNIRRERKKSHQSECPTWHVLAHCYHMIYFSPMTCFGSEGLVSSYMFYFYLGRENKKLKKPPDRWFRGSVSLVPYFSSRRLPTELLKKHAHKWHHISSDLNH